MEKLEKCDYGKVAGLFEGTNHGIPLIYSVIEGKGAGNLYVDSVSEPQNALISVSYTHLTLPTIA